MNSNELKLYNTLSREKEVFSPLNPEEVRMYTCGPTVYDYVHLGNLRAYVFPDVLRRMLEYAGLQVKQEMNLTDVGHLTSDADSGEDKMTKGLLREGKALTLENMRKLADFYAEKFKEDAKNLNVKLPLVLRFASDYIKEDVELVKKLEEKGYIYKTGDGIYFNTSKMPDYGTLWGGKRDADKSQARIAENPEKKNQKDFALWKFNSKIGFPSPWGKGFPGWHVECSAMSMKFLGEQFDIHTGGIDLIPTHHTNEIAQSECATGKSPFVRFWMHNEFVDTGSEKMSKSAGNFLKLDSLSEKNISPTTYRFWLLMASYRTKVNFVWEALEGAETALKRQYGLYLDLENETPPRTGQVGHIHQEYQNKFKEFLEDDLDRPRALSLLWEVFKDENISNADKKATILDFDKIFGLGFADLKEEIIPEEILKLGEKIEEARKNKNFKESDRIREKIEKKWEYEVKNTATGTTFTKKKI